jgi:murein DD-endopeptidase MepM/ murein hydrolase activator NlpD
MAKAQLAIDGKKGKDWKITSLMGYRIHPVLKTKKHHNGTDIWSKHEPCWIEAPYDAKVIEAKKSTAAGGGFGNYVKLLHKIDGKFYTTLYAHMADGLKVKVGQKIEAGAPLGKMASTGMSTGKHLHWELKVGKTHTWNDTGEGYIEPVAFFEALVAKEKAISTAPVKSDPNVVAPEPVHGEDPVETTPAPSPTTAKPKAKAVMYTVKSGDSYWAIAEKYHAKFGGDLEVGQYVKKLQTWNKSAPLNPGDKVRVN